MFVSTAKNAKIAGVEIHQEAELIVLLRASPSVGRFLRTFVAAEDLGKLPVSAEFFMKQQVWSQHDAWDHEPWRQVAPPATRSAQDYRANVNTAQSFSDSFTTGSSSLEDATGKFLNKPGMPVPMILV